MSLEAVREALLWCVLLNYAVLVWWFAMMWLAHGWLYRLHSRWFRISPETFDAVHYGGMTVYKVGVLLLNLVPYVALSIVR